MQKQGNINLLLPLPLNALPTQLQKHLTHLRTMRRNEGNTSRVPQDTYKWSYTRLRRTTRGWIPTPTRIHPIPQSDSDEERTTLRLQQSPPQHPELPRPQSRLDVRREGRELRRPRGLRVQTGQTEMGGSLHRPNSGRST